MDKKMNEYKEKEIEGQRDEWSDVGTNRKTDRQADEQANRWTD